MSDRDDSAFLQRLLATFRMEADEHLRALCTGLMDLEQAASPERRADVVEA
ncbi:MAG: hypothetical protein HGA47_09365, partial [Zoogloea sp.]|nr:hypothetical protein [Zoogloea sp.]